MLRKKRCLSLASSCISKPPPLRVAYLQFSLSTISQVWRTRYTCLRGAEDKGTTYIPGLLRLGSTYTFVGTHPVGRTSRARPPTWWWFRLLVLPWSFIHGRVRVPCRRAPALAEEGRESHPGPLDRDASRRQDDRFDGRVQVGGIGWSRSGHGSHPRGRHQHQSQRQARTGWGPGVAVVAGGGRWWWRRWWWLTSLWMQYTVTTLCRG